MPPLPGEEPGKHLRTGPRAGLFSNYLVECQYSSARDEDLSLGE